MAHMNAAEFEALWENVKKQPLVQKAEAPPIRTDLSLTGFLNQYLTMAANQRDQGKISQLDYDALNAAATALKTILARIKDSELVAEAMAQNAAAIEQKMRAKTG